MKKTYKLFIKTGKILECFRGFKQLKKKKYARYILDKKWSKNPFINIPNKNLSSATNSIIFRYMTSIILFFCQL
ncbi:hypothetical protein STURON_00831 [Spiroplasma turonicum]|uniref:Uncharacterized protein n=1 Tax=Spiroplasma turonicum TaxID=216946 RepID=A0A0K1P862_9MOLU|nr:hypothetical protein [Spiroplasma turonicum]AKU80077.1 hypothetical protein STURON_00831 [Spiroplasma turonicum]